MVEETRPDALSQEKYLNEVLETLSNENHKRLIKAYKGDNPVQSMESKLGEIVMEILNRED